MDYHRRRTDAVNDIVATTETTYWVIRDANGNAASGQCDPGQVTTFGNGTTMLWSGTDHAAWVGECTRHEIDTGEPEPGSVYA